MKIYITPSNKPALEALRVRLPWKAAVDGCLGMLPWKRLPWKVVLYEAALEEVASDEVALEQVALEAAALE